ncbi:hypothetical protein [Streptomyces sp. Z26]|uniref:hypothetical protein n=1 Tax=Streptomyces sp. Z26 TaxID=2500177 RepID=UPI000EF158DD|nr:hypothetical protein [Streptomyces sp. Z26]RLL67893.1 hypothetical protein D7M15_14755 [Streptomyces sp. Z26]
MEILLARAALAPSVVLLASVVARRLGPRRGGQLLGAPTTSGPFLLLVCAESGPGAAGRAAQGSVASQLVVAVFCLVYGRLATRTRPARALPGALLAAAGAALVAAAIAAAGTGSGAGGGTGTGGGTGGAAPIVACALVLAVVAAGLRTWPPTPPDRVPARRPRRWETPMRMAVSGVTVVVAVVAARELGTYAGGVLCSLPVLLSVMAPAVHRTTGSRAAAELLRGALTATAGTVVFLFALATGLPRLGAAGAFPLALVAMPAADVLLRTALARRPGTGHMP